MRISHGVSENLSCKKRSSWPLPFAAAVAFAVLAATTKPMDLAARAERRILGPRFVPGETLRYRFDIRRAIAGHVAGPIENPESASRFEETMQMLVRVDALGFEPVAGHQRVDLRASCEKSLAEVRSDAYDPQAAALEQEARKLEGTSAEFGLWSDGSLTGVQGSDDPAAQAPGTLRLKDALVAVLAGTTFPVRGIHIGEKWSREKMLEGLPLAGIQEHEVSTYVRDEACRHLETGIGAGVTGTAAKSAPAEGCAVILTKFETRQERLADPTPEDFRHNGLRTTGRWSRKGQTLASIALSDGRLMRATETYTQDMNLSITNSLSGSRLNYAGEIKSETEITLLSRQAH